tara:strand:+ start:835 stop:1104 length:270 start_codon:yes stop_codon:yes gene_type:complete
MTLKLSLNLILTQLFQETLLKKSGMNIKINHAKPELLSKLAASVESQIKIQELVFMPDPMILILLSTNFLIKLLKNITVMMLTINIFLI